MNKYRLRQIVLVLVVAIAIGGVSFFSQEPALDSELLGDSSQVKTDPPSGDTELASEVLDKLVVKGRAPKTGYVRAQFGNGWGNIDGCDTRNIILNRDLTDIEVNDRCQVIKGLLNDPYTGKQITFERGKNSGDIQIDHVVALSDAWQKGAQSWTLGKRTQFANDPLNLLAVDGPSNQNKGDSDTASWLPSYKPFRCQYVARQISVKFRYDVWVTQAEKDAMKRVLAECPGQVAIE
jgi:hypothetical protein